MLTRGWLSYGMLYGGSCSNPGDGKVLCSLLGHSGRSPEGGPRHCLMVWGGLARTLISLVCSSCHTQMAVSPPWLILRSILWAVWLSYGMLWALDQLLDRLSYGMLLSLGVAVERAI